MIRRAILIGAFVLAGWLGVQLWTEVAYLLSARHPVATILLPTDPAPSGLVFVFQPEDCLSSGELLERWDRVYRSGEVRVVALVVGSGGLSERQARFFRERALRIPIGRVAARDAAIVAERLGYSSTPFAVILDRQSRVAGSFPAGQNVPPDLIGEMVRGN